MFNVSFNVLLNKINVLLISFKIRKAKNSTFYAIQFILIVNNAPVYHQQMHEIVGFVFERASGSSKVYSTLSQ